MFLKYFVTFFTVNKKLFAFLVCWRNICGIKKKKVYVIKVSCIFSGNKIYLLYRLSPKIEMFDKQTILIGGFWQFANNIAYKNLLYIGMWLS